MNRYYYNESGDIVVATFGKMMGGSNDTTENYIESDQKIDIEKYHVVNGVLEPKEN